MKTFATSVVAAVILAATTSSPTLASNEDVQLGMGWQNGTSWRNGMRWQNGTGSNGNSEASPPKRRIVRGRMCRIGSRIVVINGRPVQKSIYGPCR